MNKELRALKDLNSRTFNIDKAPYDEGVNLYKKSRIVIKEGVTVLVGPNGMGKSTLLETIEHKLDKNNIPVYIYDNKSDGGHTAMQKALNRNMIDVLCGLATSSEGEQININLGTAAREIGNFVRRNQDKKEIWILIDAIDSGFSIDNIIDMKTCLFDTIIDDCKSKDITVYIVCTANSYELCNGEYCFDVYNGKYITFSNYDEYRTFILKQKQIKDQRYNNEDDE